MTSTASGPHEERLLLEPRWPIALVLGFFIAVSIVLRVAVPNRSSLGPDWLVPGTEIGLLLLLLAADPARVSRRRSAHRRHAYGALGEADHVAPVHDRADRGRARDRTRVNVFT